MRLPLWRKYYTRMLANGKSISEKAKVVVPTYGVIIDYFPISVQLRPRDKKDEAMPIAQLAADNSQ